MASGPYERPAGPTGNRRGLQMTGEDSRHRSGITDQSRTIGTYSHSL